MTLSYLEPPFENLTHNDEQIIIPHDVTRVHCKGTSNVCVSGWKPGSFIMHEFGHALGMMHEHQNNCDGSNPIRYNKTNVVDYFAKEGHSAEEAYHNVLKMLTDKNKYIATPFDPLSIMMYALEENWFENGFDGANYIRHNFELSEMDKHLLRSVYPKKIKIYVRFVDAVPEKWKKQWTTKVINETFGEFVNLFFLT
jgi:hypothetical protein